MTATPGRTTFVDWYQELPLGPINNGTNGQAEGEAWPAALDAFTDTLDAARKVAFPDFAPADALPYLGRDRKLVQGSNETDASFRTRLKDAWAQWSRAGTFCSVLEQLAYFGLTTDPFFPVTIVQQNGLATILTANPTPGVDPTPLVSVSNLSATVSTLTSVAAPFRTIPAGTPWFDFDGNTDMTNRFAVIVQVWPFSSLGFATFNNSDTAVVTWPVPFGSVGYRTICGPPSSPVILSENGSAQATTTATIMASGPWTGTVPVIGFFPGTNPLNTFSLASLGQMRRIIQTFRPNAICMGVFVIQAGEMWDFPAGKTWDGDSNLWDSSTVSQILGAF